MASLALLFLIAGPGGLLLALAISPLAPWLRYWMLGLFGWVFAFAIAALLSGTVM